MVFGWQKPHKSTRKTLAPQTVLSRQGAKPSWLATAVPVPETIAEDGCEVVPQFFPGVVPTGAAAMTPVSKHQTGLTIDTDVRGLPNTHGNQHRSARTSSASPAASLQRRAGSIKAASLSLSPSLSNGGNSSNAGCADGDSGDLPGPRSAPAHQSAHAPKRSSNGSSISSASTFVILAASPSTQQLQASRLPLAIQRHSVPLPQSHEQAQLNAGGTQRSKGAFANISHGLQNLSMSARMSDEMVRRRASAIDFSLGPSAADATLTDARPLPADVSPHIVPTAIAIALADEDRPGSYAQRRRGSIHSVRNSVDANDPCSSGSSTATSSTVASPVLSQHMHRDRLLSTAHHHFFHHTNHKTHSPLFRLRRNNTTRTVTHNDLLVGTNPKSSHSLRSSGTTSFRHFPSSDGSTGYSEYEKAPWLNVSDPLLNAGHIYYSQTPMSAKSPTFKDYNDTRYQRAWFATDSHPSPVVVQSPVENAICDLGDNDDTDIASKIVPKIDTVGKQFAYLPPRSKKLSVTN
ncbi:hypothetical protein GGI11_001046 [Coemansia sp. RSA 2049]|nr:hypothetical protein GGI11_001046 [Coemansia sp. RSA 2049]